MKKIDEKTQKTIDGIINSIKGFATFIDHNDYPNEPRFTEIAFNDIPFKLVIGLDGFYFNGESYIASKESRFQWHIVTNEKLHGLDKFHFTYNLLTTKSFECYKTAIKTTIEIYQNQLNLKNNSLLDLKRNTKLNGI